MNYSGVRQILLHQELLNSSQRQGLIKLKNQGSLLSFTKHNRQGSQKLLREGMLKKAPPGAKFSYVSPRHWVVRYGSKTSFHLIRECASIT